MKKQISIFKKIRLFNLYKKTIKSLKSELNSKFGARVDDAFRIYNVINVPSDIIGEPYNLRRTDIDKIAENFVREYSVNISEYLNTNGMNELYDFYEVSKVDKYSYLVVIGFSLFRSNEYYDKIRFRLIPIISLFIILLVILFSIFL